MLKWNCARRSQVNWLLWTPAAATPFFNPGGLVQTATNHSDASSTLEVVTIPSGQLSQQGLEGVIVPAIIMAALLVAAVLTSAAHLVKSECSHNDCGSGARGGGAGGSVGGRGGGGGGPYVDPNSPMPEMARHPNLVQQQLAPGTEGRKVDLVANFYKFNTTGMAVFHCDLALPSPRMETERTAKRRSPKLQSLFLYETVFRFIIGKEYAQFQRKFYNMNTIQFVSGFTSAVRMTEFGLALNLHLKTSCVISHQIEKLTDIYAMIGNITVGARPSRGQIFEVNGFIRHLRIVTRHCKNEVPYTMDVIVDKLPSQHSFKDRDGLTMSIAEYFKKEYNLELLNLPLIKTTGKHTRWPWQVSQHQAGSCKMVFCFVRLQIDFLSQRAAKLKLAFQVYWWYKRQYLSSGSVGLDLFKLKFYDSSQPGRGHPSSLQKYSFLLPIGLWYLECHIFCPLQAHLLLLLPGDSTQG